MINSSTPGNNIAGPHHTPPTDMIIPAAANSTPAACNLPLNWLMGVFFSLMIFFSVPKILGESIIDRLFLAQHRVTLALLSPVVFN